MAKVGKKVFVFFGTADGDEPGMSVKLRESREQALFSPGAEPTGYGLGRAGWVTVPFRGAPPAAILQDWVEESYRTDRAEAARGASSTRPGDRLRPKRRRLPGPARTGQVRGAGCAAQAPAPLRLPCR